MEKQNFLMEVMDIVNGRGKNFENMTLELVKEAIRTQARTGQRSYAIAKNAIHINMNGVGIVVPEETVKKIKECLIEEGFTVSDINNYFQIEW